MHDDDERIGADLVSGGIDLLSSDEELLQVSNLLRLRTKHRRRKVSHSNLLRITATAHRQDKGEGDAGPGPDISRRGLQLSFSGRTRKGRRQRLCTIHDFLEPDFLFSGLT